MYDYEALATLCLIEVAPELMEAAKDVVEGSGSTFVLAHVSLVDAIDKYEEGVRSGTEAIDLMRAEHQAKAEPTIREAMAFRSRAAGITPEEVIG